MFSWIFLNGGISCNPKHFLVLSALMVMFPSWVCYVHTPIRIEHGDSSDNNLLQVNPANQRMLGGGGADGGILAQKIFFSSF